MYTSYKWLQELTATKLSAEELRDRLTMVGLAIDAVETQDSDSVLDVEVPSNRPDCLSHLGIAREITAIESGQLHLPDVAKPKTDGRAEEFTSVEIKDSDLCPRYAARLVRGVKIGPSPDWLVKRLEAIGQRPINNVADITNYVLHEVGQPLHAFDFANLKEHKIIVRRAKAGEKLKTLDGVERELQPDMLVIADAERPVALAGIMGGEESEISSATGDVLIESAYFNPSSVRLTARALGMDTEASRRFERGADCENILNAQERCVQLICEIAGGVATENSIDVYPNPSVPRVITLRTKRVEDLTSLRVETRDINRILTSLGFDKKNESEDALTFGVPSWRVDVEQEEDLVEEVARHSGYHHIRSELPPSMMAGEYQPTELKQRLLRRTLNDFGYDEAINYSFIRKHDEFDLIPAFSSRQSEPVELSNPIIEDAAWMRPTLLPGLLDSLKHNLNHGMRDVRLFEIGRIFGGSHGGDLPEERLAMAMLATGGAVDENVAQAPRELDLFDLKGAFEAALDSMNMTSLVFRNSSVRHLRMGQAGEILLNDGKPIGTFGRLAESIASSYKFRQPVYVLEMDLSALFAAPEKTIQYSRLPKYPSVVRDLTLLVGRDVTFAALTKVVKDQNVADCRDVNLVGTYEGPNIPAGKRSITLRIEYRADDRTLRDEEVEERHASLTASLLETFAAEQR
ncbi:MAG TPA: phenylalanine--tRNA ligase subunit beta [Pyrinomonadaceae bacterium]|nr:phenylalanine--tRNA ligase subunit beta [Pyrinomonadaceae bacterium]